ncbi:MAG: hypothetical protein V5A44_07260 [Haloarculaceae archaeon]
MAAGNQSVVDAIRVDLRKFHETWMELVFPRQRGSQHSVLGKWTPETPREKLTYNGWSVIGMAVIAVLYPMALVGVVVRFHARKIEFSIEKVGAVGVFLLAVLVWGGLAALVEFRLNFPADEANAIVAASVVAILATGLALVFRALDGRPVTVLLSYPLGMTAIFLPPLVAALLSDQIAQFTIVYSEEIAVFLQDEVLAEVGLRDYFVRNFDRNGGAYVIMWVAMSVPLGWLLGVMVTLADFIRPKDDGGDD